MKDLNLIWSMEYPLDGKPMMTHVFDNNNGKRIVAAKDNKALIN
jgi:hypothetical protein